MLDAAKNFKAAKVAAAKVRAELKAKGWVIKVHRYGFDSAYDKPIINIYRDTKDRSLEADADYRVDSPDQIVHYYSTQINNREDWPAVASLADLARLV